MRLFSKPRIGQRNAHLVFMMCALFFAATSTAQQPKIKEVHASSDHPLWRGDLKSQGYPANDDELQRRRGFANFDTISFVSDTTVAATFVTRENIPDLQRREDPNHIRPYRLHAIFLDASTGKVLHALDWPIDDPNAGIFPRHDGGFVLVTAEKIASYSADWAQLKEVRFSGLHPATATVGGIAESPSTKSLVIQFLSGNSALCLRIRTDTLEAAPTPCGALEVFTVSDDRIIAPEKLPGGANQRESGRGGAYVQYGVPMPDAPPGAGRIEKPDQAHADHTICNPCVGIPQFINNDEMAVYSPENISVVDRTGKVSFAQDFYPTEKWIDELGRPVRSSANGQRFAIVTNRSPFAPTDFTAAENGGTAVATTRTQAALAKANAIHMSTGDIPAEMPLDVVVYDLSTAQWIYALQIKTDHLQQIWGLALSPNAEILAIDSGGIIQIFTLPMAK
jgi:hypothetical protein